MKLREWHHGYLGLALILVGVTLGMPRTLIVGVYVAFDDFVLEHLLGAVSPLLWCYRAVMGWLDRTPAVAWIGHGIRQLNVWLDSIFGRGHSTD
jgi:hypothetical protein